MFQAGDTVVHPFAGVCRVLDIRNERFGDRPQFYYVIASTQDKGGNRIYVPVDGGKILLRRPLSKREVQTVLQNVSASEVRWPENEKERAEQFSLLLRKGTYAQLVKMIALLHQWKDARRAAGKKMPAGDERLLQEAQQMIHREFAYALGLDEAQTIRYIMNHIAV